MVPNCDIDDIFELTGKLPPADHDLIVRAYAFAEKAHDGQMRKSGEPYFVHAFATAKNLAEFGMNATLIAAGFLHDTIEDTDTTEEDIQKEFGKDILHIVEHVTKLGKVKYKGVERNVENLRKFFISIADDLRVVVVKLADRLHNIETLEHVRPDKQVRIALETLEIYAPLANRLSMGKLKGRLEDGSFKFANPKEYEEVSNLLEQKKESQEHYLHEVRDILAEKIKEHEIDVCTIDYRAKYKYSLWKKLQKYDNDIGKIHDIIALRVIVPDVEDCYHVLGIVHSTWKPFPGRLKDYIATPKPNGYQSIHTTVFTGTGGVVEIQIRTKKMHIEAEDGLAAHFSYKEGEPRDKLEKQYQWVHTMRELQKNLDKPDAFLKAIKMDFFRDRIFVFTPDGDIIDLPEDASAIDFAYAVHTDIGNQATGVKINGSMKALSTKLKSEDVLEIIRSKNAKPSSKWLEYAKTALARKHINNAIKNDSLLDRFLSFSKFGKK